MIVLDMEMTGVDEDKNSIVSIGAVDFHNTDIRFFEECQIWQGAHVEPEALAINGYTHEQITDASKKTEEQIVSEFFAWIMEREERTIAGQNPQFDTNFLRAAGLRYKLNYPLAHRTIDLHSVAYLHMMKHSLQPPVKNHHSGLDSDTIMKYVGIPAEPKPHIALNGAIWETEALYRLLYDRPYMAQFHPYTVPWVK
jgi:DNA polymerase III epsilon subunit-like protein